MGLDISFARTEYEHAFRAGSYSSFGMFREVLALEDDIVLNDMSGFGGANSWYDVESALLPILNHSDCDGELYAHDCEEMLPRMKEILGLWESGHFAYDIKNRKKKRKLDDERKKYYAESLREWIAACERVVDNYNNKGINEYLAFH